MGWEARSTLPARVDRLGRRIARWRRQRPKPSPMPEELWAAAVSLARSHGVGPIARALRLDYGALKKKMAGRRKEGGSSPAGFIELDAGRVLGGPGAGGPVVELWGVDGSKLVVRLAGRDGLDLLGLAEAFWKRRA